MAVMPDSAATGDIACCMHPQTNPRRHQGQGPVSTTGTRIDDIGEHPGRAQDQVLTQSNAR